MNCIAFAVASMTNVYYHCIPAK